METLIKYLECNWGIQADTTATILLTVSIFLLGLLATEIIKFVSRLQNRITTRQVFSAFINGVVKQIAIQKKAYYKTSLQFTFESERDFVVSRATIAQIDNRGLDYASIYSAYFKGLENLTIIKKKKLLKVKAFNKLWESLDTIAYWHKRSFDDMDFFRSKYESYNDSRNESLDEHRRLIEKVATTFDGKQVDRPFGEYIQSIDKITVSWQAEPDRTRPDKVQRKLVVPIRILNRRNGKIALARHSSDILLLTSMHYENMYNLLKLYKFQYFDYGRIFKNSQRLLNKCLKIL